MKIQRYYHSCLLVTEGDAKILFDPGSYSFMPGRAKPESFSGIDALFITHNHADHMLPDVIKTIVHNNSCKVYGNQEVAAALREQGIEAEVLTHKQAVRIGDMTIEAFTAEHGPIPHANPQNTAFIVNDRFLHPGDSLDPALLAFPQMDVLALPMGAPWMRLVDGLKFAKDMRPKKAIAIHDGIYQDAFNESFAPRITTWLKEDGIEFFPLGTPEDSLEI